MQPRPISTASALAFFPTDSQEESFYLSSIRQWTDQDVATWLSGCKCAAYAPLFRQNDLCGEVILDLTQASLKEMGITSVGDRARILVAVKQLRQKCYASSSTSTTAARRTTMPPGGWPATRRYTYSAPATPFFSPTGAISETAPVTPGSAPFYAPTGAIYFSPLPEMDTQSDDLPVTLPPSAPGFSGLAATTATPAIRIQNPSPLEPSLDRSRLIDPASREAQEATKWGVFGSSPLPPAPSQADSQAPPSPDNQVRPPAPAQQVSLETKHREPIPTPAPLPAHMTHGRKMSRRHGQLYVVATPPPPTMQSLKAY